MACLLFSVILSKSSKFREVFGFFSVFSVFNLKPNYKIDYNDFS
nr:MAG TPA: hypothetical protein [Caudoviricetes sp.]